MPNPMKIASLGLIAALSIGAMAVSHPRQGDPAIGATELGVLYAAPAEDVETHVIGSGETLNGVLTQAKITGQELADLLLGLRQHLDPNRLSAGAEVTVRRFSATDETRSVEVRLNRDTTVKLAKLDYGWQGGVMVTPTKIDTVYAAGEIESGRTIYEALVLDETSPLPPEERVQLVGALAGIFEYKLDFTREIQPGDSYRLVYEREARPDNTARARRILAAEIVNDGSTYDAIYFDNGTDTRGYFDPKGRPLRAGFSRYPVDYPRITSRFAASRYHPILGIYRAHMGNDLGARAGTPVKASANGVVVRASWNSGGYGNLIEIRHANGYSTRYAHLRAFARGIHVGSRVSQKDVIGYVGMTGLATAPHLHYELRLNGRPIDATRARLPDGEALGKRQMAAFKVIAAARSSLLDRATGTMVAHAGQKDAHARDGL
jgi:murein DD-endopeptidase MepM/ murein hydrolase activator NlpD